MQHAKVDRHQFYSKYVRLVIMHNMKQGRALQSPIQATAN